LLDGVCEFVSEDHVVSRRLKVRGDHDVPAERVA
jgi:hypothetical protein